jgi:hypothetical protein
MSHLISNSNTALSSTFDFLRVSPKKEHSNPLEIIPFFNPSLKADSLFFSFVEFIEQIIRKSLPSELLLLDGLSSKSQMQRAFQNLKSLLPILNSSSLPDVPNAIAISCLCPAEYTEGVGRYINDVLCRWLLPGKEEIWVGSVQSLNFQFRANPDTDYYFSQFLVNVGNENDRALIMKNFERIQHEIRLNILAVSFTRGVIATKPLSHEEKERIIKENLISLLDPTSKGLSIGIFEKIHDIVNKIEWEKKVSSIKSDFYTYLSSKPNLLDKDIYGEIQNILTLFNEKFTSARPASYVTRLVSFFYLFRKSLLKSMESHPKKRHISWKIVRRDSKNMTIGLLISLNLLQENEIFEKQHLLAAVKHCIPAVSPIKESYLIDRRDQQQLRLLYLEIEKNNGSPFSIHELKQLRLKLSREVTDSIENVIHPVFMPRNEEEIMRNIVLLSKQLNYVQDIPQTIISFDTQTAKDIAFNVIMLRLLTPDKPPLKELFSRTSSSLKFQNLEVKIVGTLRKKHLKEANVFTVKLDKKLYLRKDYSLDLFKARQTVFDELTNLLGEIRDFNGGILSKQHEVFHGLKNSLLSLNINNDFLLENYFYSLTPPLSRSILPSPLIKDLFLMLLEVPDHDYKRQTYFYKDEERQDHLLVMTSSTFPLQREMIFSATNKLGIPANDLTFSFVDLYEFACLGYILRSDDPALRKLFKQTIKGILTKQES